MPEIGEILQAACAAGVEEANRATRQYIDDAVKAVQQANGGGNAVPDLLALKNGGFLPDFFAGAQVTVSAQLAMTTQRDRTVSGTGGLATGPITLSGSLSETFRQGTTTNLSVSIVMERQSGNTYLEYALRSLKALSVPALPASNGG